MSEKKHMTHAAAIVGAASLLSRIFGFVRDVTVAAFFGAGPAADAFFTAFRIPNLMRRLFAEGTLSMAFIPVFTRSLTRDGQEEAFRFAGSAFRAGTLILTAAVIAGIWAAPLIVRLIAPGFVADPSRFALTVTLTRLMFPYILLICLVALCMGILNTLDHFTGPALAPLFLNLSMIAAVFLVCPRMEIPAIGLAVGVLAGGFLQLGIQMPFLVRSGVRLWKPAPLFHPELKRLVWMTGPSVLGAAAYQINVLTGTLLASLLAEGSISCLYYADRLVQFPLGVFASAVGTAVLPGLSRQAASGDIKAVEEILTDGLRLIFFVTLPAMTGLIVLREPVVALLFERGAFDARTTGMTAGALLCYSAGLWAFAGVRVIVPAFYALQDTRTPVKIAVITVLFNLAAGIILMKPLAHNGVALAASLASGFNLLLLVRQLQQRFGILSIRTVLKSACRSAVCSVIMGETVRQLSRYLMNNSTVWGLAACIGSGVIVYIAVSAGFRSPELKAVLSMFFRKQEL